MSTTFVKPSVVISKCLGFAHCRYNGLIISDDFVEKLVPHVKFNPVCPECEIGLGVPRNPIRIISLKGNVRLVQPATENDVTEKMEEFAQLFLKSLHEIDGFILKNRSPSCGIKDVRIYPRIGKVAAVSKGTGFFGGAVLKWFPDLAIEDEGRLRNFRIREHFLMKLFTLASFRQIKNTSSMKKLIQFHSENKFLLMAYNQTALRNLGRAVANPDKQVFKELIKDYESHLHHALTHAPRYTSNINVLLHAIGYFKKGLTHKEKTFFLDSLQQYREGRISLCTITSLMRSWIIRFDMDYLQRQTFFEPYPEELVTCFPVLEREKKRDYWE